LRVVVQVSRDLFVFLELLELSEQVRLFPRSHL
jgi:hypothetical protein